MKISNKNTVPVVGSVMTPFPHSVRPDEPLDEVERLIRDHEIRHIPVQDAGRVVGIISERDLHTVSRPSIFSSRPSNLRAKDLATPDPYLVEFATPLDRVVKAMGERRIGTAIVVRQGKLAGILSVVDVCRVLSGLLEHLFPAPPPGDDAA